jgi:LysM repeat protein
VTFALALFIVVSNTTKDDGSTPGGGDSGQPAQTTASPDEQGTGTKRKPRRSYTVKTGDTPSGIAEKVNVPLDQILELNPDLDPQTLTPGTKIKLR